MILACRNLEAGKAAAAAVEAAQAAGGFAPATVVQHLDLSSLASVRKCADEVEASGLPLSILINNAGVFDLSGARARRLDARNTGNAWPRMQQSRCSRLASP